ncbi:phenylacetate-CoA ligase [Salinibacter ruber]|uniref:phenylacetate--CoA ligase family protein n=1 Tax=Salinibacter ruber TaxID=146919 RepID=UPI0021673952|nr:hypothetical protein [Salinibacter ruber]MCS3663486.1 phenylacetate-CoA ligase [Salinibacter ruber]
MNDTTYNIYKKMPVWIQNMACSIAGYAQYRRRYNSKFSKYLEDLKESEWWDIEEIKGYQNKKISEIVTYAYKKVPFYRRVMDRRGISPKDIDKREDLKQLPIIDKNTIKKYKNQFKSDEFNDGSLIKRKTSGTTGNPLELYMTKDAVTRQRAVWWRHKNRFGIRPWDKRLSFGARVLVPESQSRPPYWRYNWAKNQYYLSIYHIKDKNIKSIAKWLNEESFDFFEGYPSAIYNLACQIESQNLKIKNRPKYIFTGADALIPEFKQKIENVFGVKATEHYGMAEACGNISKCEKGSFHVDHEFGVLETVSDKKGAKNEKRMIFTGFHNKAMPLIRYDIGDYCTMSNSNCSCGRSSKILKSIDGRIEDFVRTKDGGRAVGMNRVFKWAEGVQEIQIVQKSLNKLVVRIKPDNDFDFSYTKEKLSTELKKRIGEEIEIEFDIVEEIPRSKSGKYRAVVSEIESQLSGERALKNKVDADIGNIRSN